MAIVPNGRANCDDKDAVAAFGITECLCLAATPIFAIMALLTSGLSRGSMDTLCSAAHGSPLGGMISMYLLMSVLHSAPWLNLAAQATRHVARYHRLTWRCPRTPGPSHHSAP